MYVIVILRIGTVRFATTLECKILKRNTNYYLISYSRERLLSVYSVSCIAEDLMDINASKRQTMRNLCDLYHSAIDFCPRH